MELFTLIPLIWLALGTFGTFNIWSKVPLIFLVQAALNNPLVILGPLFCGAFFGPYLLYVSITYPTSITMESDED